MERVAFLLPHSGAWIRCLLNPEGLSMQRRSGVRAPLHEGQRLIGRGLADDPILVTGGGSTRLVLNLLFDVAFAHQAVPDDDVRHLSDPIWRLGDAAGDEAGLVVRLVWGKSWNIPGIVMSAAQRFDDFQQSGIPRRNWMSLEFRRVADSDSDSNRSEPTPRDAMRRSLPSAASAPLNGPAAEFVAGQRIDLLAATHLGDPAAWRELAAANDLDDPFAVAPTRVLRLPGLR